METRPKRSRSSSSTSISRSRSPISNSERRSISTSPRRGPSTPVKSSTYKTNSDDEQDREPLTKAAAYEISSPIMSDTEQNHQKKRSHHGHQHRHHKQSKSSKRPISHHRQSAKRNKKETISTSRHKQSDDDNDEEEEEEENSVHSPEKNASDSEQSPAKQEVSSSGNESNDEQEEGMIEGNSTPSDHRSSRRRHRKKHHSSSTNNERTSQSPQSPSNTLPKTNKGTQLIVNYLPETLREADFYQLFARIAPIKLCKLITDRHTGHSYCYGFIEYHTKEDALKAIKKYNGYGIEHKKLKVSYAEPKSKTFTNDEDSDNKYSNSSSIQKNPNVYITELPDDFDEKMLKRLFSKYGDIVQAKILRDPRTRISRGVGFVLMTSTRYAERAIKALDGYVPSGAQKSISVKYADPKKTAAAAAAAATTTTPSSSGNHSSISRLSNTSPMANMIGSYGYPSGYPPINMIDPYYAAALHHHHHRAAMNMREMSRSPPLPPPLPPAYYSSGNSRSSRRRSSSPAVSRSYSSSSKHNSNSLTTGMISSSSRSSDVNATSLAAAYDLISKGCQQAIDPNGFVIYAFGLPRDCVEHELEELFQRYGDVYRVYIVKNYTTGESKGYSFVTMRNYDEACHAVEGLHNTMFKGRTIQVRFKQ